MSIESRTQPLPTQLELFSSVLHAYGKSGQPMSNDELYEVMVEHGVLSQAQFQEKSPVGKAKSSVSLAKRRVRWIQQGLRQAQVLERVPGRRGVWQLTGKEKVDTLKPIQDGVALLGFSTDLGVSIVSNCDHFFKHINEEVHLLLTSSPYPLARARDYGNPTEAEFVDWICKTIEPAIKSLAPGGSLALNLSNDIFMPKSPARSMYCERLVLALHDRFGLELMDRLVWSNRAKPPGPIAWASKKRVQLNVSYEPIFWFTNDPSRVFSDNRRVLQPHSEQHKKLISSGGEARRVVTSDGAYRLRPGSFGNQTLGTIPKNVLSFGHSCQSNRAYRSACKERGLPVHGATMPLALAKFLIEFLTQKGQLVADCFAGSGTTGLAAQELHRRWLMTEKMGTYVQGQAERFKQFAGYQAASWI